MDLVDELWIVFVGFFAWLMDAVVLCETALRSLMPNLPPATQSVIVLVLAMLLILGTYRLIGGVFSVLVTTLLLLLMAHVLVPGFGANLTHLGG